MSNASLSARTVYINAYIIQPVVEAANLRGACHAKRGGAVWLRPDLFQKINFNSFEMGHNVSQKIKLLYFAPCKDKLIHESINL